MGPDGCASSFKVGARCGAGKYKGDGFCDDNNNNMACNWDGGDCCGPNANKQYCKACKCLDCNFKIKGDACIKVPTGSCGAPKFKGDGFCDDNNNNAACSWDKGDCCGNSGKQSQFKYCKSCKCRDCTKQTVIKDSCVSKAVSQCGAAKYKGDGFCDDNNNNCACSWDGGDCCKKNSGQNYQYCKVCFCFAQNKKGTLIK